jgi:hypothetical protein
LIGGIHGAISRDSDTGDHAEESVRTYAVDRKEWGKRSPVPRKRRDDTKGIDLANGVVVVVSNVDV